MNDIQKQYMAKLKRKYGETGGGLWNLEKIQAFSHNDSETWEEWRKRIAVFDAPIAKNTGKHFRRTGSARANAHNSQILD